MISITNNEDKVHFQDFLPAYKGKRIIDLCYQRRNKAKDENLVSSRQRGEKDSWSRKDKYRNCSSLLVRAKDYRALLSDTEQGTIKTKDENSEPRWQRRTNIYIFEKDNSSCCQDIIIVPDGRSISSCS